MLEAVAVEVGLAAPIPQGGDAGHADGHADRAQPEGAAVAVGDDHADGRAGGRQQRVAQGGGRGVGIARQQQHCLLFAAGQLDVGAVDAGVGAGEAQPVADDDHPRPQA